MGDFLEKKPKKHSDAALATAARFSWVGFKIRQNNIKQNLSCIRFLKPFLKGTRICACSGLRMKFMKFKSKTLFITCIHVSDEEKIFLPEKIKLFAWWHCIFFGLSKGSFSKINCRKQTFTFPSDFVKSTSEIFIFGRKMVVCVVVVVRGNFVRFGLLFLKSFLKGNILQSGE